ILISNSPTRTTRIVTPLGTVTVLMVVNPFAPSDEISEDSTSAPPSLPMILLVIAIYTPLILFNSMVLVSNHKSPTTDPEIDEGGAPTPENKAGLEST